MKQQTNPLKKGTKAKTKSVDKLALSKGQEKYKISLEAMLKAGLHFGHKKARWNPKMREYIFTEREGVHIINLEKTIERFSKAMEKLEQSVKEGGLVLLVGTKKQAQELVKGVAENIQIPYVNERWMGGTLTNFGIIKKRLKYLSENKALLEEGKGEKMTKLEKLKLGKKLTAIDSKMGGLEKMTRLPDLIFFLDIIQDKAAVLEAKKMKITTMGLVDTNGDPSQIDYPIPANDDAFSAIKYVLGVFMKTILEAKSNSVSPKEAGRNETKN